MTQQKQVIEILSDLVGFPSLTPDAAGSLEYVQEFISNLGGSFTRIDRNQTTNLLASIGRGSKIFAYAGHVDVVPPGDLGAWVNQDPYTLFQVGEKLIGRGVADMKGSIAAFLVALRQFVATAEVESYRIMLLLTSDEEGSAVDGTQVVVEYLRKHHIRFNYCLVGEPSCVSQIGDTVKVGRRGSLSANLQINGQQGHIAYPHLCINPIHSFAPALAQLISISWDQGNQFFPPSSLQFANLNSGLGVTNVIPGVLKANFNFRYNTEHTAQDLQHKVENILTEHNLNYSISWQHSAQPFLTKIGQLSLAVNQAVQEVCQIQPMAKTDGGTSDGRFLIAVSDELVEFGLCNDSIHQINEASSIPDVQKLTAIYANILSKVFNE